jgi:hypothetical protein
MPEPNRHLIRSLRCYIPATLDQALEVMGRFFVRVTPGSRSHVPAKPAAGHDDGQRAGGNRESRLRQC